MILLHITKENREPKVGEWYKTEFNTYSKRQGGLLLYADLKALSISVILDAPDAKSACEMLDYMHRTAVQYPISNAEQIFQWLHDNGKLGEEWVEWPGAYDMIDIDNDTKVVHLFNPDCEDKQDQHPFAESLKLLRELADLQNGAPLERYRKEWESTMTQVYSFLEKWEGEAPRKLISKDQFISKVSKINETFEDEFKAEYNSPELIWKVIKKML